MMKNKMPLDGLGLGHDSGSVHCDMLKMLCFRTAWGGVKIGNNVSIAHNCSIVAETHNWDDVDTPISYNKITPTPVRIDDDVWLGCGVRVIGPCHIKSRVIIAAGAVVKGETLTNCILGGVPARIIKEI